MNTPKGKATPQATGNQIRTGNGTEKSLVKLEPPKGKTRKRRTWKARCETRFDRESDAKESDRVGNARQQDKEENEGKRPEGPGETGPK
ncbi:hypothetical protein ACIQH7_32910, partial [Streptomyces anulatus]